MVRIFLPFIVLITSILVAPVETFGQNTSQRTIDPCIAEVDFPWRVLLLVDGSGSMNNKNTGIKRWPEMMTVLRTHVKSLQNPNIELKIIVFNSVGEGVEKRAKYVTVFDTRGNGLTMDKKDEALNELTRLELSKKLPKGTTPLYYSVIEAIKDQIKWVDDDPTSTRVGSILVYSDGGDDYIYDGQIGFDSNGNGSPDDAIVLEDVMEAIGKLKESDINLIRVDIGGEFEKWPGVPTHPGDDIQIPIFLRVTIPQNTVLPAHMEMKVEDGRPVEETGKCLAEFTVKTWSQCPSITGELKIVITRVESMTNPDITFNVVPMEIMLEDTEDGNQINTFTLEVLSGKESAIRDGFEVELGLEILDSPEKHPLIYAKQVTFRVPPAKVKPTLECDLQSNPYVIRKDKSVTFYYEEDCIPVGAQPNWSRNDGVKMDSPNSWQTTTVFDKTGDYDITLQATRDGLKSTKSATITVVDIELQPKVVGKSPFVLNQPIKFQVTTIGKLNPISFEWQANTSNNPDPHKVGSDNSSIDFTFTDSGKHKVRVRALLDLGTNNPDEWTGWESVFIDVEKAPEIYIKSSANPPWGIPLEVAILVDGNVETVTVELNGDTYTKDVGAIKIGDTIDKGVKVSISLPEPIPPDSELEVHLKATGKGTTLVKAVVDNTVVQLRAPKFILTQEGYSTTDNVTANSEFIIQLLLEGEESKAVGRVDLILEGDKVKDKTPVKNKDSNDRSVRISINLDDHIDEQVMDGDSLTGILKFYTKGGTEIPVSNNKPYNLEIDREKPTFTVVRSGSKDTVKPGEIIYCSIIPANAIDSESVKWTVIDSNDKKWPVLPKPKDDGALKFPVPDDFPFGTCKVAAKFQWKYSTQIRDANLDPPLQVIDPRDPYTLDYDKTPKLQWGVTRTFAINPNSGAQKIAWDVTKDGNKIDTKDGNKIDLKSLNQKKVIYTQNLDFSKIGVGDYAIDVIVTSGRKETNRESATLTLAPFEFDQFYIQAMTSDITIGVSASFRLQTGGNTIAAKYIESIAWSVYEDADDKRVFDPSIKEQQFDYPFDKEVKYRVEAKVTFNEATGVGSHTVLYHVTPSLPPAPEYTVVLSNAGTLNWGDTLTCSVESDLAGEIDADSVHWTIKTDNANFTGQPVKIPGELVTWEWRTEKVEIGTYTFVAEVVQQYGDPIETSAKTINVVDPYGKFEWVQASSNVKWGDKQTFTIQPNEGVQSVEWFMTQNGKTITWLGIALGEKVLSQAYQFNGDEGVFVIKAVVTSKIPPNISTDKTSTVKISYEDITKAKLKFNDYTLRGDETETFHGTVTVTGSVQSGTVSFNGESPKPISSIKPGTYVNEEFELAEFKSTKIGDIEVIVTLVSPDSTKVTFPPKTLHHKPPQSPWWFTFVALSAFSIFVYVLRRFSGCASKKWRWRIAASADALSKNPEGIDRTRKYITPINWNRKGLKYSWMLLKKLHKKTNILTGDFDWLENGGKVKVACTASQLKLVDEDKGSIKLVEVVSGRSLVDRIHRLSTTVISDSCEEPSDLFIRVLVKRNTFTTEKFLVLITMLGWIFTTVYAYTLWIQ